MVHGAASIRRYPLILPNGCSLHVESTPTLVRVPITDAQDRLAARGQLGAGTYAGPDRIVTGAGHQRLGLGSVVRDETGQPGSRDWAEEDVLGCDRRWPGALRTARLAGRCTDDLRRPPAQMTRSWHSVRGSCWGADDMVAAQLGLGRGSGSSSRPCSDEQTTAASRPSKQAPGPGSAIIPGGQNDRWSWREESLRR